MFLKKLIEYNGIETQKLKLYEEMSELQKELIKNTMEKQNTMEIIEEVADVEIMLEQVKLYYGVEYLIEEYKKNKIKKLKKRFKHIYY